MAVPKIFYCSPYLGKIIHFDEDFSNGSVQPPTFENFRSLDTLGTGGLSPLMLASLLADDEIWVGEERPYKGVKGRIWIITVLDLFMRWFLHGFYHCKSPSKQLEPETSVYKWLFQLDDLESLHEKWLFHQKHPFQTGSLEFQVLLVFQASKSRKSKLRKHRWEGCAKISCVVLGNTLWFSSTKIRSCVVFSAC